MAERVNVKALRERLGMSRAELGERVSANKRTVRRWENGESDPSPMAAKHLAQLFEDAGDDESSTRRKSVRME